MNKLMKFAALGAVALMCSSTQVFAEDGADDATEEVSSKKAKKAKKAKKGRKAPKIARMLVAVDKFENKAGVEANQFSTIRARIKQAVVGTRKFEVLEREQMKNVLSEQNLMASGMTNGDDPNAPEAGMMKAAGYVIYGNVLFYGVDQNQSAAAGSASMRTKVELQINIASAETGKILATKSVIGIGKESRIAVAGTSVGGNIQEQCERAAVAEAAHGVVDALRDLCYPAKVVKVGKRNVIINMTNEEVSVGEIFDVIEQGEEIFDPDTGASLGSEGDALGRIRVTRVGPKVSTAVPCSEDLDLDEIEVGYFVRRVSKETIEKEVRDEKRKRDNSFEAKF